MTIRPASEDELTYVRSTWLACLLQRKRMSHERRNEVRAVVERLLRETVLVWVEPGDGRDEQVQGWICVTPLPSTAVVHFAYTRERRRAEGIGSALLCGSKLGARADILRPIPTTAGPVASNWHNAAIMGSFSELSFQQVTLADVLA